jgi:thermostable 8-oxoguanine DNA glycosylase
MAEVKIKTHTTYTYETTDGREFEDQQEATEWQLALDDIKSITMLDHRFCNTTEVSSAYYVHIKTLSQLKAFEAIQKYEGMSAHIDSLGYWYYDENTDRYVSVRKEMDRLQSIIETLDVFGK